MPTEVTLESALVREAARRGHENAELAIVEFSDYQCPFCRHFSEESFSDVQEEFVDSGKAQYFVMNLPLEHAHPHAFTAAETAECMRDQSLFWQVRATLFRNQQRLEAADLMNYAVEAGADAEALTLCLRGRVVSCPSS